MSLRRRVVLGCLAVAVVLVVADAALASTFRGFLLQRVDEQLAEAAGRFTEFAGPQRPGPGGGPPRGGPGGRGREPLSEFYVGLYDDRGAFVVRVGALLRSDQEPPEPAAGQVVAAATGPRQRLRPFSVDAADGEDWRLVAVRSPDGAEIIVVGASLATVAPTYERMILVLVVATLAVFAMLGVVAWWVLRQGVRPLLAMTATAEAIAGDALHSRVPDTDERTEAGRLAIALNTMLERLQTAFTERAASEERLRRFVADASHELRTPLTSIRGYAELYRAGGLSDPGDMASAMRRVEQEGERMGELVEDLLLLAKLDEGRPLERRPVDLAALTRDAVADLRAVQPQRPVDLQLAEVSVVGDDARLRQAVGNLLANVRVHTSAETAMVVRLTTQDGQAVVEVADEGPGLPSDVADRVFERFYRADPARARASGGFGLGLAIVAGIAEAHGGRVEVASEPGAGATFRIRLPLSAESH